MILRGLLDRFERVATLASLLALPACGGAGAGPIQRPELPPFDAERAWQHMEAMVAIGAREAGSPGAEKTRKYIEAQLEEMGLEAVREPFSAGTPAGRISMCNLHVTLPSPRKKAKTILVCSHYDTKRMPFRFDGANDGASSTAALIEIARVLRDRPSEFHYRLIFLDGEEAVNKDWVDPDNTYGSRFHARELQRTGEVKNIAACIVLDMIGDKDLKLEQDPNSDRRILNLFFDAAKELGYSQHIAPLTQRVLDDHLSFIAIGIPSIDLIDLEFGPNNDYWHSSHDKLENCSPESVRIASEIFLAGLPKLEEHLLER